jgi:hypothetical protein
VVAAAAEAEADRGGRGPPAGLTISPT